MTAGAVIFRTKALLPLLIVLLWKAILPVDGAGIAAAPFALRPSPPPPIVGALSPHHPHIHPMGLRPPGPVPAGENPNPNPLRRDVPNPPGVGVPKDLIEPEKDLAFAGILEFTEKQLNRPAVLKSSFYAKVVNVTEIRKQIVSGWKYSATLLLKPTLCRKAQVATSPEILSFCRIAPDQVLASGTTPAVPPNDDFAVVSCKVQIHYQPWRTPDKRLLSQVCETVSETAAASGSAAGTSGNTVESASAGATGEANSSGAEAATGASSTSASAAPSTSAGSGITPAATNPPTPPTPGKVAAGLESTATAGNAGWWSGNLQALLSVYGIPTGTVNSERT